MKTEIIPIDDHNLNIVADLLFQRNKTIKEYTEWKYSIGETGRFKGVIAFDDGKPIGCIGSVPKKIKLDDGTKRTCGWFADWYVSPDDRGMKIGELLLNALSDYEPIMFGHPGPKLAQKICLKNQYKPIVFHARRRFVLRKLSYSIKKGIFFKAINDKIFRILGKKQSPNDLNSKKGNSFKLKLSAQHQSVVKLSFLQNSSYKNWLYEQPYPKILKRKRGEWKKNSSVIKYFDEQGLNREKKRSILFFEGQDFFEPEIWTSIITNSRNAKQDYIEVFTTDPVIDLCLQELGAWKIEEAPIMVRGLESDLINCKIQAWDRENWTYIADGMLH